MTTYYNDIEEFPCRVLEARIAEGRLPAGFVDQRDITTINATELVQYRQWHLFAGIGGFPLGLRLAGVPDDFPILTGGFPCQDISCAGKGEGIDGSRSGLFWRMLDVIRVLRPQWLFLENVPALRTRGFDRVADALEAEGYAVRAAVVGAWAVGAPHKRDRVWIVANRDRRRGQAGRIETGSSEMASQGRPADESRRVGGIRRESAEPLANSTQRGQRTDGRSRRDPGHADECGETVAIAERERRQEPRGSERGPSTAIAPLAWPARPGQQQHDWEAQRLVEFQMGQPVDGLSRRLASFANRSSLKALGNAVVPQVVAEVARHFLK